MNQAHRKEWFRGCSRPDCRICRPLAAEPPRESLALTLVAFAGVALFVVGVILLWVAAS